MRDMRTLGNTDKKVVTRSADHEYYGQLPKNVDVNGARQTSHVEAGGIYYFQAWNAFSLNFRDMDISPYKLEFPGILLTTHSKRVSADFCI